MNLRRLLRATRAAVLGPCVLGVRIGALFGIPVIVAAAGVADAQPNVLVILIDDVGVDKISIYEHGSCEDSNADDRFEIASECPAEDIGECIDVNGDGYLDLTGAAPECAFAPSTPAIDSLATGRESRDHGWCVDGNASGGYDVAAPLFECGDPAVTGGCADGNADDILDIALECPAPVATPGVLFRNGWASPTCSPTRASLLTGQLPFRTGVGRVLPSNLADVPDGIGLDPEITNMASVLRNAGYRTAAFGKWHMAGCESDGAGGCVPGSTLDPLHPVKAGMDYFAGTMGNPGGNYCSWTKVVSEAPATTSAVAMTSYPEIDLVDEAMSWINEAKTGSEPWLAWVGFHLSHKAMHDPYRLGTEQSPPLCDWGSANWTAIKDEPGVTAASVYGKMTEFADDQIARLLTVVPENTVVILVGDNGTYGNRGQLPVILSPLDGSHDKGTMYEGGVNVPFIVNSNVVAGPSFESPAIVSVADLFETVMEIVSLDPCSGVPVGCADDSASLFSVLAGGPAAPGPRTFVRTERFLPDNATPPYDEFNFAVRRDVPACKLIVRQTDALPGRKSFSAEMFDLASDPTEQVNLLLEGYTTTCSVAERDALIAQTADHDAYPLDVSGTLTWGDFKATDFDADGEPDASDSCPYNASPTQADTDGDGIGDACDDIDGDGVFDAFDNCVYEANAGQEDSGGIGSSVPDGIGDACQCGDNTGDGIVDDLDVYWLDVSLTSMDDGRVVVPALCSVLDEAGEPIGVCDDADLAALQQYATNPSLIGQVCSRATGAVDVDDDGLPDVNEDSELNDNCPFHPNPHQFDADGDQVGDWCQWSPPVITVTSEGETVTGSLLVEDGESVRFDVSATDADGLGYPIYAHWGVPDVVEFVWNFGGASTANPYIVFTADPLVTFDLPAGQSSHSYELGVWALDATAEIGTYSFTVNVVEKTMPEVTVYADGVEVTGPLSATDGQTISFSAVGSDPDGLGYPVFAYGGNMTPVSYMWGFDGADHGWLAGFTDSPDATFHLLPEETERTYDMQVNVYDIFGNLTVSPFSVHVTRP